MTTRICKEERFIPKVGNPVYQIQEEADFNGTLQLLPPRQPTSEELKGFDGEFAAKQLEVIAELTTERDSLKSQVAELEQQLTAKTTEAATLATEKQSLSEQVDTLKSDLAESKANATALQNRVDKLLAEVPFKPRHIRSDAFVDRISSRDMLKLAASTDPVVQRIREKLLEWDENDWRIELDNPETVQPIQYLLAVGVLTEDSAKQLLRDATRQEAYMETVE